MTSTIPLTAAMLDTIWTSSSGGDESTRKGQAASHLVTTYNQSQLTAALLDLFDYDDETLSALVGDKTGPAKTVRLARRLIACHITRQHASDSRDVVGKGWKVPSAKQLSKLIRWSRYGAPQREGAYAVVVKDQIVDRFLGHDLMADLDTADSFFEAEGDDSAEDNPYLLSDAERVLGLRTVGKDGTVLFLSVLAVRGETRSDEDDPDRQYRLWDIMGFRQHGNQPELARYVKGWREEAQAAIEAKLDLPEPDMDSPQVQGDRGEPRESIETALAAQHGAGVDVSIHIDAETGVAHVG